MKMGFTIGGARQQLSGDEIKSDSSLSKQIIKQMREELEDVLALLKSKGFLLSKHAT